MNDEVRNATELKAALAAFILIHDNRLFNIELENLQESLRIVDRIVAPSRKP